MGDYKTMKPKLISSVEELYTLKGHQPFTYRCSKCGKNALVKHFDRRDMNHYIKLLCRDCLLSQPRKSLPKIVEEDVLVTDPDQFDSFRKGQHFHYICKECGDDVNYTDFRPSRILSYRKMLCKACSQFKSIHPDLDKLRKIPKVIFIKDQSELNRLSEGQLFSYNCKECGLTITEIYRIKKDDINSRLYCMSCKRFKFPETFNKELRLDTSVKKKPKREHVVREKKIKPVIEKKSSKKRLNMSYLEINTEQKNNDESFMWYSNFSNCRNCTYPNSTENYVFNSKVGVNPYNVNSFKSLKDSNNTYVFQSNIGVSPFDIK